ncbi:DNA gyrase subunit B [Myxococcus sp. K38C18041901]|uniref:DNA gyrase subunit B n=1 Tax=Myxococcus guangdongensis TaxID=2906760 RepID=UPI0020A804BF|nr:DNA gyrase subunit B [Myxococcus guangdongensis]MCP3062873.1 DNA gyrase subunit B [Myxococcus guangdongensis]
MEFGLGQLVEVLLLLGFLGARNGDVRDISVELLADGACRVTFDDWPWPSGSRESARSSLERWLSFEGFDWSAPPPLGLPRGVISLPPYVELGLVNALASRLEVIAWEGAHHWRRSYREGLAEPESSRSLVDASPPRLTEQGLCITFTPDASIFEPGARMRSQHILERLQVLSALHPGVTWRLRDVLVGRESCFHRTRGLADLCDERVDSRGLLSPPWSFEGQVGSTQVGLALQWGDSKGAGVQSWANIHRCYEGGTHHQGLHQGLRKALRSRMKARGSSQGALSFPDAALVAHLTAVLSIGLPEPVWKGPTRTQIANPELKEDVAQLVATWLEAALAQDSEVEAQILALSGAPLNALRP